MFSALIFSLLLFAAEPAIPPASETTPPAPSTPEQPISEATAADKTRMVCRRESKPNTRFTTKICKTVAEWEERSKTAQESFEDVRGRPMVKICPPVGGCD